MNEDYCLFPSDDWKPCDKDCQYYLTCIRRKDRDKAREIQCEGENEKED